MWFDDGTYVVPAHVVAVQPWGKRGSRGSKILMTGGTTIFTTTTATEVASVVSSYNKG